MSIRIVRMKCSDKQGCTVATNNLKESIIKHLRLFISTNFELTKQHSRVKFSVIQSEFIFMQTKTFEHMQKLFSSNPDIVMLYIVYY